MRRPASRPSPPLLPLLLFAGSLVLAWPRAARAAAAEDAAARALMASVFQRGSWDDMRGTITLTLRNKRGDTKERVFDLASRRNEKGERSMRLRITAPPDMRGTAFLQIEHTGRADDRRLYLPALRRVQRITASGSGGNFMSSDFTYYDIGMPKLDDWTFSFGGKQEGCREVVGKAQSDRVVEETGYRKIVWCVDEARKVVTHAAYFDKDGTHFKTLEVGAFETVGGVPFATDLTMRDLTTGHRSRMVFTNLKVNTGIPAQVFTERALRRPTR